ncbi:MAG: AmmeMemoRadiSam system radical SAM enzyme [Candidatus Omnitrophica bacterium]|nr:AmmeMemoRadiSam system radical SAM enzyme [Candidatus Omnitrophota bacterium]MDD5610238.1 AmmeMemoRadiSam system radical SAM enzyme [Candidatus Omnitrophota bacterium]
MDEKPNFKILLILVCLLILAVFLSLGISWIKPPHTLNKIFKINENYIRPARWWHSACTGVQCFLCPFNCYLPEGERGLCRVRMNTGNKLYTLVYAQPVAVHVDPIEKKPVYHLLPGSSVFSIATVGCNLRCTFCQNWEISQAYPETEKGGIYTPEEVVRDAIAAGSKSVAYTYSEPTVFYEYVLDTAKLARAAGLKNVLVSAGYINPAPLKELVQYFDVVKIDLKGFNEKFYKEVVGGNLRFVLNTLVELKKTGVFTEVVNLIVPGLNDNMDEIQKMCAWIYVHLGPDTPLFFSRFTPQYKLTNLPETPIETLEKARSLAMAAGLHYVYIGNVPGHPAENTYCPRCKRVVVRRYGYRVLEVNLKDGCCIFCGYPIVGIWQ